jgi:CheY-like chemotaxis protein
MPGLDGLTATSLIRERETATGRRRLPIIALTANALADEITRCREADMDAHVAKPVDWSELFVVIDRVIRDTAELGPVRSAGAAVLDDDTLNTLAEILGAHRVPALLSAFMEDLRGRIGELKDPGTTCQTLRANAHALVSLAGQLGFAELSALSADIEGEAETGAGLDRLPELSAAAARAIEAAARARDARTSEGASPLRHKASA